MTSFAQNYQPHWPTRGYSIECPQQCREVLLSYQSADTKNYRRATVREPCMVRQLLSQFFQIRLNYRIIDGRNTPG